MRIISARARSRWLGLAPARPVSARTVFMEAAPKSLGDLLTDLLPGFDLKAHPTTVRQILKALFPGCDIAAGLERVLETLAEQLLVVVARVSLAVDEAADRIEKMPPVPGYEPMLIERGYPPFMARGLSHGLIRWGKDEATKVRAERGAADALRFLAKPGRTKRSSSRRAAALLETWHKTPDVLGDAFDDSDVSLSEFVEALEGAVRGEFAACLRVTEVAAAVAPRCPFAEVRR